MMDLAALADQLRRVTVELTSDGRGTGAGVVWAPELIVTNAHVLRGPRVLVRAADGRRVEGRVLAGDRAVDLALVRVPGLDVPPATCQGDESLTVGSLLVALGHPLGVPGAVTRGIVHAIGALTPGGRAWIQGDLKLAPGNSGGPLADAHGRVVGVNAMIVDGLALAIPVREVRQFARSAGVAEP
jgi:serine protease Do